MKTPPIVSPAELVRLLASNQEVVVLDARPEEAYRTGHIAGARHADLETKLSTARDAGANPAHGGRHPLPPLERWSRQLGEWGITPATRVVVYDDQNGANAAARAWWMLRAVGHDAVSVLDGSVADAARAGISVTTAMPDVQPCDPYPVRAWQLPTVDMAAVDHLRGDRQWRVLDVRSSERFRGETEPIDPVAGHIPGAINLPYAENLENGHFKAPAALRAQYEKLLGGAPSDHLVVHCGSGVTACHTLLALDAAGLAGAALYVGSWSEWCRNEVPRATND